MPSLAQLVYNFFSNNELFTSLMNQCAILGALNDFWMYDIGTGWWTYLSGDKTVNSLGKYGTQNLMEAGNSPGGRWDLSIVFDSSKRAVYIFGGLGFASVGSHSKFICVL